MPNYDILLQDGWAGLRAWLKKKSYSSIGILTDENTDKHCLPILRKELPDLEAHSFVVASGEQFKDIETCQGLWQLFIDGNMDRHSLLINLGGGVVGDMGGFCASTYMRGMDFIQIPTTLLAQVDASIGGKVGIDFKGYKNMIGQFRDPSLVLIEPRFLKTLPPRELQSGFAEMLKHALISSVDLWNELKSIHPVMHQNWLPLIEQSLRIKRDIVLADPLDQNVRKALNFGHTFGHAIESAFMETEDPLLHGEAVAIGICMESEFAYERGLLSEEEYNDIVHTMHTKLELPELPGQLIPIIQDRMWADKKKHGGTIYLSLVGPIGTPHIDCPLVS